MLHAFTLAVLLGFTVAAETVWAHNSDEPSATILQFTPRTTGSSNSKPALICSNLLVLPNVSLEEKVDQLASALELSTYERAFVPHLKELLRKSGFAFDELFNQMFSNTMQARALLNWKPKVEPGERHAFPNYLRGLLVASFQSLTYTELYSPDVHVMDQLRFLQKQIAQIVKLGETWQTSADANFLTELLVDDLAGPMLHFSLEPFTIPKRCTDTEFGYWLEDRYNYLLSPVMECNLLPADYPIAVALEPICRAFARAKGSIPNRVVNNQIDPFTFRPEEQLRSIGEKIAQAKIVGFYVSMIYRYAFNLPESFIGRSIIAPDLTPQYLRWLHTVAPGLAVHLIDWRNSDARSFNADPKMQSIERMYTKMLAPTIAAYGELRAQIGATDINGLGHVVDAKTRVRVQVTPEMAGKFTARYFKQLEDAATEELTTLASDP